MDLSVPDYATQKRCRIDCMNADRASLIGFITHSSLGQLSVGGKTLEALKTLIIWTN